MAKIRIYELAKELGADNKKLETVVRGLGIEIKNYMSTLTPGEADKVRARMGAGPAPAPGPARKRKVIRRRGSKPRPSERVEEPEEVAGGPAGAPASPTTAPVVRAKPAHAPTPGPSTSGPVVRQRASGTGVIARSGGEASRAEAQQGASPGGVGADSAGIGRSADAEAAPQAQLDGPDLDPDSPKRVPAVGERIELPSNTRRFVGGLRDKLDQEPEKPEPAIAEVDPPATGPIAGEPTLSANSVPNAGGVPQPQDGRRNVIRDADGVIVAAAKAKSEPQILGFIPLPQRPRPRQQVIITEEPKTKGGRATARKKREERAQQQARRKKTPMRGRRPGDRTPKGSSTVEMKEEKKRIRVDEAIQVADLAHQMGVKASKVIRALWSAGLRGITINNAIDVETAELVAAEFGYTVENVSFQEDELVGDDEEIIGELRAPVVTVMGHVDHGKTTLLDFIRQAKVADGEAGGITQHVGAYRVETNAGPVVFIDTPGHEAFSAMRERGAHMTDIVVLIVAADDGVMPTTLQAIKFAREASVPIVVAINKVDKPEANVGRVKQMLMKESLVGEEFGGDTTICEVSAKTGQGIDALLEVLAVQAELLELKAPVEGRAAGIVVESRIDKGRGTVATLLIQTGSMEKGDIVVANESSGKVRQIFSTTGKAIKNPGPSMPVEILGLDGAPPAGEPFHVVENEKAAKQLITHRRELRRRKESVRSGPSVLERIKRKKVPILKIVLRADVAGSAEAVKQTLEELSVEKVRVEVIFSGVGAINETDVKMASAADNGIIIGFNVKTVGKAAQVADQEKIDVLTFGVIYDAAEKVQELMVDLLEPEYLEKEQGEAEVRMLFPIPRLGVVAGCRVMKGLVTRTSHIRVRREGEIIYTGKVGSLRVVKDDVKEVKEGFECGIVVENYPDVEPGDVLESFELQTIRPTL